MVSSFLLPPPKSEENGCGANYSKANYPSPTTHSKHSQMVDITQHATPARLQFHIIQPYASTPFQGHGLEPWMGVGCWTHHVGVSHTMELCILFADWRIGVHYFLCWVVIHPSFHVVLRGPKGIALHMQSLLDRPSCKCVAVPAKVLEAQFWDGWIWLS